MKTQSFIILTLLYSLTNHAQNLNEEDSVCQHGKKYTMPARKKIPFPAADSSAAYKLRELKKAVQTNWYIAPDSVENYTGTLSDQSNLRSRLYQYYFLSNLVDYDEKSDTVFSVKEDSILYKLKDTYVFDINGDGLPDMIHYPKYYRRYFMDGDFYDIIIQQKDGYKMLIFDGYIVDITFDSDQSLKSLKTFSTSVYAENHSVYFRWYTFDKTKNELVLTRQEDLYKCQLIR